MVSNAFFRSINIAIVEHSASTDDNIFSVISTRAVMPETILFKIKFFLGNKITFFQASFIIS